MNGALNLFIFCVILLSVFGCGGEKKLVEIKSGRLKYVKEIEHGPVGTHGSKGWFVADRRIYVDDKLWKPENIDVKEDIFDCEASPNAALEILKCESLAGRKNTVYILRMNNDQPEWVTAYEVPYERDDSSGEWADAGRRLLFKDFLFNAQTSEKRAIKLLPEDPRKAYRAVSPDLKTIVFEEKCFFTRPDLPLDSETRRGEIEKQCAAADQRRARGIAGFRLIDAETGTVEIFELKSDQFDWLEWNRERFPARRDWLLYFERQIVWEKDKTGKYRIVRPAELKLKNL